MTVVLFALICLEPSVTFVLLPLTCLHPIFFSRQGHCIGTIRDWEPVHATNFSLYFFYKSNDWKGGVSVYLLNQKPKT